MAKKKSFQHEKPPSRINLFLEVQDGGAKKKKELPLRLLVTGNFSGREDDTPLTERDIDAINKNNFSGVMKDKNLELNYTVENKISDDGGDMKVNLKFDDLDSFHPEQVAKQIPELGKLLATRNLLQDLRNRLISMNDFRKQLESVIKDKEAREKLLAELGEVIQSDDAAESEDAPE